MADPDKKVAARQRYMMYEDHQKIADDLGVSLNTVLNWIAKSGWKSEREATQKMVIDATITRYNDRKKEYLPKILEASLALIHNALDTRIKKLPEEPMTIREAAEVSVLMGNLDKLQRLDAGEPTEIQARAYAPITIEQLRSAIAKDPFLDVIPVKHTRITGEENASNNGGDADSTAAGASEDLLGTGTSEEGARHSSKDPLADNT